MEKFSFRVVIILTVLIAISAHAADWTKWRGPNANGTTTDDAWNPLTLKSSVNLLWDAGIGKGHSAATIKGERVYTMGNRQTVVDGDTLFQDIVWCLDAATGREVWRYAYPCDEGLDPGPGSTPVIDGDRLYTISREGHLFCFDAADGRVRWMRNIVADSLTEQRNWGYSGSPVIDGDILLLNVNRSGMAFDKSTGDLLWNSPVEECGFETPVLYQGGGRRMAAFTARTVASGVDVTDGSVKWEIPGDNSGADPVLLDDKILLTRERLELFHLGTGDPELLWENRRIGSSFSSWVVIDGYAYGYRWVRRTQYLSCVDMENGEIRWTQEDRNGNGSLIAAGDKLIILSQRGGLVIAEASPDAFVEIASADVMPMADNTGVHNRQQCHCWTNPVLAGGRLYLRNTYGNLVCIDLRS